MWFSCGLQHFALQFQLEIYTDQRCKQMNHEVFFSFYRNLVSKLSQLDLVSSHHMLERCRMMHSFEQMFKREREKEKKD